MYENNSGISPSSIMAVNTSLHTTSILVVCLGFYPCCLGLFMLCDPDIFNIQFVSQDVLDLMVASTRVGWRGCHSGISKDISLSLFDSLSPFDSRFKQKH